MSLCYITQKPNRRVPVMFNNSKKKQTQGDAVALRSKLSQTVPAQGNTRLDVLRGRLRMRPNLRNGNKNRKGGVVAPDMTGFMGNLKAVREENSYAGSIGVRPRLPVMSMRGGAQARNSFESRDDDENEEEVMAYMLDQARKRLAANNYVVYQ
jgi:hypothetical protein